MDQKRYRQLLHEALAKAFAARTPNVRSAYFDLASFYHEKLGSDPDIVPTNAELQRCLGKRDRAA